MVVTCLRTAIYFGTLLLATTPVFPQRYGLPAASPREPVKTAEAPILDELRFTGLRRITRAAVAAQIASHPRAAGVVRIDSSGGKVFNCVISAIA